MTRHDRWKAGVRSLLGLGLFAGVLPLSGCGSSQVGSVVLKADPDAKAVGAPPRSAPVSSRAPVRQKAEPVKKVFAPG